ncbi:MAG TPA: hypothetical protein VGV59_17880 [Pyrinomonadaceae bacterium]|nr:hypothetical protein [Pyrinomonadaceae bacterium]
MRTTLFGLCLLLLMSGAAYAQQTANNERTGWYASNPLMVAVIAIPLVALIVIGAFLLFRRRPTK